MLTNLQYSKDLVVVATINKTTDRVSLTAIHKGQVNPIKKNVGNTAYINLGYGGFYSCDVSKTVENTMIDFAKQYEREFSAY